MQHEYSVRSFLIILDYSYERLLGEMLIIYLIGMGGKIKDIGSSSGTLIDIYHKDNNVPRVVRKFVMTPEGY